MPDGRFISRSIAINEQLARVSLLADHLFTKCIPHLDVEGRLPGNPKLVKSIAVPLRDEITAENIPGLLGELGREGLLQWYSVAAQQVLAFPGFGRQQRGLNKDREAPSRLPSPSAADTDLLPIYSGPVPEPVRVSEFKVSEEEGKSKGSEEQPVAPTALVLATPSLPVANGNGHALDHALSEVSDRAKARNTADELRTLQARLLFAYWQAQLHHESALLDPKRLTRLKARLTENRGDVHELLFVIDGALRDRNLMGENDRNRKYDGIETIYRDRGQVERLAELVHYTPGKIHPMAARLMDQG